MWPVRVPTRQLLELTTAALSWFKVSVQAARSIVEVHPVSLDTHLSRETGMMKPKMNEIDRPDAFDGPVDSEGGRSCRAEPAP